MKQTNQVQANICVHTDKHTCSYLLNHQATPSSDFPGAMQLIPLRADMTHHCLALTLTHHMIPHVSLDCGKYVARVSSFHLIQNYDCIKHFEAQAQVLQHTPLGASIKRLLV
jgi:hypothetical protein